MNKKALFFLPVLVLVLAFLLQQANPHNPKTGRVHGTIDYTFAYRENNQTTGTVQYHLVSGDMSTPVRGIITPAGSNNALGICMYGCGTSGEALIVRQGDAPCSFDGPTTALNLVVISPTQAGKCHDMGWHISQGWPRSGRIIGVVLSTNAQAGVYMIGQFAAPARGHLQGLYATATLDFPSAGGGNCNDLTVTVSGAIVGQPVLIGHPASGTRGVFDAWVSAADEVTVRHCSVNGVNDPPSADYSVVVIQ